MNKDLRKKAQNLFIHYGSAASEAMFDFPCHYFELPDCEGVIAYRTANNCAVVFGEPICPPHEIDQLTKGFQKHCQKLDLNIIYIIVSEKFAKRSYAHNCQIKLKVCEEFIYDPFEDPCLKSHRLTHRVDKGVKHGLTVHEYIPKDQGIENALIELGIKWQKAIKGPQIYLGHLDFFETYDGKRWFYVKDGDKITSMVMLSRLEGSKGWLLKFLITEPGAFHETSEFLITSVFKILEQENCHFLTKGMVPVDDLNDIRGLGVVTAYAVRLFYKLISWVFNFKKRKEYWMRYDPKKAPSYLLFFRPKIGLNEIRALLKVLRVNG